MGLCEGEVALLLRRHRWRRRVVEEMEGCG